MGKAVARHAVACRISYPHDPPCRFAVPLDWKEPMPGSGPCCDPISCLTPPPFPPCPLPPCHRSIVTSPGSRTDSVAVILRLKTMSCTVFGDQTLSKKGGNRRECDEDGMPRHPSRPVSYLPMAAFPLRFRGVRRLHYSQKPSSRATGQQGEGKYQAPATTRRDPRCGDLRASFAAGRTRPAQWRAAQLKGIVKMIDEKEADITAALHDDLAKPHMESYLHE
uniref:Uncharacterized protein n=1 Tax=Setaria italica TaxID=4555 RepID=A0A0Q3NHN9_SETIT